MKSFEQQNRVIVMIGTSLHTKGGISSVVKVYFDSGLGKRWPIQYLSSHSDGNAAKKIAVALTGMARFLRLLLSRRVAIVHVHSASNASFWRKCCFIVLARLGARPVIFHLHGGGFIHFFREDCGPLRQRFIRWILDGVRYIVVMSERWRNDIGTLTANRNIVAVPNPVVVHTVEDPRFSTRSSDGLLFLGRLSGEKGVFDLLEAVALLCRSGMSLRLILAGDGDMDGARKTAQRLGVAPFVHLPGWVTGSAKDSLLADAAAFVLPSYVEGLPMGLLEAMSASLPVVATSVGAIPEVLRNGIDGYVVAPGDINGLAAALATLLKNKALRDSMGSAARKRIDDLFSAERVLPRIESLYRELGLRERFPPDGGQSVNDKPLTHGAEVPQSR